MDCGSEVGSLKQDKLYSDDLVAIEKLKIKNAKFISWLIEKDASAELILEVIEGAKQNVDTVSFLIDEVKLMYSQEYRLWPKDRLKLVKLFLDFIDRTSSPMVKGLIRDLFRDWPMLTEPGEEDDEDYRERKERP
jgi:hypothetical protein